MNKESQPPEPKKEKSWRTYTSEDLTRTVQDSTDSAIRSARSFQQSSSTYFRSAQVSLWDGIIPSKEHAKFSIHTTNKYRFVDQGSNLRGRGFNMTMHWHVMPKTGKMFADKIVMSGYQLPEYYK